MIYINLNEIKREAKKIQNSSKFNLAMSRAINRTLLKMQTNASKSLRQKYKFKSSAVKKSLKITKASRNTHQGKIESYGYPLSVKYFGARQTQKGVTVNIKGSRKLLPGAFIAKINSYKGVFARGKYSNGKFVFSKKRLPISSLRSVSVPLGFVKSKKSLISVVDSFLPKRLAHELQRLNQ